MYLLLNYLSLLSVSTLAFSKAQTSCLAFSLHLYFLFVCFSRQHIKRRDLASPSGHSSFMHIVNTLVLLLSFL